MPAPAQASEEMAPSGDAAGRRRRGFWDGGSVAMELLDDCWCFRNVLVRPCPPVGGTAATWLDTRKEADVKRNPAGEAPAAGSTGKVDGEVAGAVPVRRSLLRTPSLPPRAGRGKPAPHEGGCPHKPGGASLRHSYSNLEGVLSFPPDGSQQLLATRRNFAGDGIPHRFRTEKSMGLCSCSSWHSSNAAELGCSSQGRQRPPPPPRDARVESIIRYVAGHHRAITGEGCRGAFQVRKWRSLGDLEVEEAQGFRDLGFVFDGDAVSPGVLRVIPGLRQHGAAEGKEEVRRPHLSEAWLVRRSAPPALDWFGGGGGGGGGSAADVKEQLRVWARVVASNVRQECC